MLCSVRSLDYSRLDLGKYQHAMGNCGGKKSEAGANFDDGRSNSNDIRKVGGRLRHSMAMTGSTTEHGEFLFWETHLIGCYHKVMSLK